jgi:hypothetical protein
LLGYGDLLVLNFDERVPELLPNGEVPPAFGAPVRIAMREAVDQKLRLVEEHVVNEGFSTELVNVRELSRILNFYHRSTSLGARTCGFLLVTRTPLGSHLSTWSCTRLSNQPVELRCRAGD